MNSAIASALSCLFLFISLTDALTFGVVGDWGMGGYSVGWFPEIRSVLQFNQQCRFLDCNFTLSVGDNIYCGDVGQCLQRSFEQGFLEGKTFFPSIGNHDNVGPQLDYTRRSPRWKFLNRYYTVKMPIDETGYTVQIFAVDTTDGALGGGAQYSWLESELKKSDARWKIIFGHYPTVGSGRHKRVGTVNRLHDIMHRYNAQAYFCGHDHIVEMSNVHGRVLGLSGGIARGGMMTRGIGGAFRRFTLTSPGEYNKGGYDWPTHGFLTVDLSPNVMNVQLFEANGGLYYDLSVTNDWMQEVSKQPASLQHEWPSPEIVLAAYKAEAKLPRGPGGGIVFRADGSAAPSSIQPRILAENETASPATDAPTATPSPKETPAPAASIAPAVASVTDQPTETKTTVPKYVKYSVSSEYVECNNEPTIDVPFTIFFSGISVNSLCRVFLTSSALGCDIREKPNILPGTDIRTPGSNVATFTVKGVATSSYVCFSMDKGQTYSRLNRGDTVFESPDFAINPPVGSAPVSTTAAPAGSTTVAPASSSLKAGVSSTSAPTASTASTAAPGSTAGHSTLELLLVGLLCVGGGIVGAKYASKLGGSS